MNNFLPVMLLKELIILPHEEIKIDLSNDLSKKVFRLASIHHNGDMLIVCPKDRLEEAPDIKDLPNIGVIARIKSSFQLPNGATRIVVTGLNRVKVVNYRTFTDDNDILMANVITIDNKKNDIVEETALKRKLLRVLSDYIAASSDVSNSILSSIKNYTSLNDITDSIVSFIQLPFEKKLAYMMETNSLVRAKKLIYDLSIELEVINLDQKLDSELQISMEETQKEYILREKIKHIKKELGENDENEISEIYLEKLNSLKLSSKTRKKILNEIKRLENLKENNPEYSVVRNYLDTILNLPWNTSSKDIDDIDKVRENLDKTHYGLEKAKERIIEYIAIKKRNPDIKSPIICLAGPPGVGKTTFAINVAKSLNREFYKISVGGLNDTNELMGNRRTYLGSNMGRIMQGIRKCNVNNPVILIDEVDKMVKNTLGDPASCLLEILDSSQNTMFIDNYVEEEFDLSKVMFILTCNDASLIPEVLYDRLEIIEITSYTELEKLNIAKKYLLPSIFDDYKVGLKDIKISDNLILDIISKYTKESGLRELKRCLSSLIRKIIISNKSKELKVTIKLSDLKKYLGNPKYIKNDLENQIIPNGLVNALAYTSLGGVVMKIECSMFEGKGEVITTGLLGEVINESVEVAISYLRCNRHTFKLNDYYFIERTIHLHFLEASIPKDGPSAGIAITTCILSLLLEKSIDKHIAMTGEISLKGDILPVGGIREKIIGAYSSDIKEIFIPYGNLNDIDDIPDYIKDNIIIKPVKNYYEIFQALFI